MNLSEVLSSPVLRALLGTGIFPILQLILTKWLMGRRAKQTALFERFTKQVAAMDALLKLKLSVSEPHSPQEASAKEAAYKQAEEAEANFKREFDRLIFPEKLESPWWQDTSLRKRLIPPLDERKNLNAGARRGWWAYIIVYYIDMLYSAVFMFVYLNFLYHMNSVPTNKLLYYYLVLAGWGALVFFFLSIAMWNRRNAYALSIREA